MVDLKCENCGSTNFIEVDGITTCKACGTKYPNIELKNIGIEEEAREKEIRRLLNSRFFILEPKTGLLTDEEILKYAPKSQAAKHVKYKRAKTIKDYLTVDFTITFVVLMILFCILVPILLYIF